MHPEKIEELQQEHLNELREEPMRNWIQHHRSDLEIDYLKEEVSGEDHPLDDDMPDFFDKHCDEFDAYCKKAYYEVEK